MNINLIFPDYYYLKQKLDRSEILTTKELLIIEKIKRNMERSHPQIPDPVKHSREKYLLNKKDMASLHNDILNKVKELLYNVYQIQESLEIFISQSWLVVGDLGHLSHQHIHSNSLVSGVYYIQTSKNDYLTFCRNKGYNSRPNYVIMDIFNDSKPNNCPLFANTVNVGVQTGDLLLFPSNLSHRIEKIQSSETRLSLAFNTFVKGNLGKYLSATELKIK